VPINERTNLSFTATGNYQPLLFAGRFPVLLDPGPQKILSAKVSQALFAEFGQIIDLSLAPVSPVIDPGAPDQIVNHYAWMAGVQFTRNLTRRLDFTADYGYGGIGTSVGDRDGRITHAGGRLSYAITRHVGFRVGYTETEHRFLVNAQETRVRSHAADAGLTFSRTFSLTQSTQLAFGTSTNAFSDGTRTHYRLNGRLNLTQQLGAAWSARLLLARDGVLDPTFQLPVFSDMAHAGLGGLFGQRVRLDAGVGVRRGGIGFQTAGNDFNSYFATAGLHAAFTRYVGAGVTYGYYRYDFGGGIELPAGISSRLARQSVHAFVNLWAPLVQKRGRP
jgi:hypothetical protein